MSKTEEMRIPVVEEHATVGTRLVETGRVKIATSMEERKELLTPELISENVTIERVAIDRDIDAPVEVRSEGDVLIVPIMEQRLVVTKQWVLKEELHIRKHRVADTLEIPVNLKRTKASVSREPAKPAG